MNKIVGKGYFNNQISVVTASHYGNWEVKDRRFSGIDKDEVVAFYKPMSGSDVEKYRF